MIGGTGTISSAITRQLAESEHELWLLNRGNRQAELPAGVKIKHSVIYAGAEMKAREVIENEIRGKGFCWSVACHPERKVDGSDKMCHPERRVDGSDKMCHPERRTEGS